MKNKIVTTVLCYKPIDIEEVISTSKSAEIKGVYITEEIKISPAEYEAFCKAPLKDFRFLQGKGGYEKELHKVVKLTCPGKNSLLVDPQGSCYGRYVGIENKKTVTVLETENKKWGCYGTLMNCFNDDTNKVNKYWKLIFKTIANITRLSNKQIQELLDSRYGRHMVDEFSSEFKKNKGFVSAFYSKYTSYDIIKMYGYFVTGIKDPSLS